MTSLPQLSFGTLSGQAKVDEITKLLQKLRVDSKDKTLSTQERDATLEKLKVYGRDPRNADPIFTKEGLEVLCKNAFESNASTTSREALRCIANALLLKEPARQQFVDLGAGVTVLSKLDNEAVDDEFLFSRVAFLATFKTRFDYEQLLEEKKIGEQLTHNLERHAKRYTSDSNTGAAISSNPMEDMALIETLKLVFGFSHKYPNKATLFSSAVPQILTILSARPLVPSNPLDTTTGQLINGLINFDLEPSIIFPANEPEKYVNKLINLLDLATRQYDENALNDQATPLVALLRRIYEVAPAEIQITMQKRLLPTDAERDKPLGTTDTFASKLLQLSVTPMAPQLKDNVSSLLFEISDKNAETFVRNVGYGFASGYLFQNDVPVPEGAFETAQVENSDSQASSSQPTNPITGQRLDAEPKVDLPAMSKEEKEREAERLFVLFERLRQNGVISAENPLAKMQQEGRFEELSSDDDSN